MKSKFSNNDHSPLLPEALIHIMGVRIDNIKCQTALDRIKQYIAHKETNGAAQIFFVNVHTIHLARKLPKFREIINKAHMMLPDGSGLSLAGKIFGNPILENLNGTDFTPKLFEVAVQQEWTIYLLGAREEVVARCQKFLLERYPNLKIVGYHDGHSLKVRERVVIDEINAKRPDILFVALGSPYQETWVANHAAKLNTRVCMAVGGLFDFIAGAKQRAPLWMRKTGTEWIFRFFQDPATKWRRVFVEIPVFLIQLIFEWMKRRHRKPLNIAEEIAL